MNVVESDFGSKLREAHGENNSRRDRDEIPPEWYSHECTVLVAMLSLRIWLGAGFGLATLFQPEAHYARVEVTRDEAT